MCDVLLLRPVINHRKNAPFFLPLGLLCVAATVREAGFRVRIIDLEHEYRAGKLTLPAGPDKWLHLCCASIVAARPLIVGLTVLADTLPVCLTMGRYLKQRMPHTKLVFGGPGVFGTLPGLLERFADSVDYVCINEGECCLPELARRLAGGEPAPVVAGLHATIAGRVEDGGRWPLADINALPMPAYDLVAVTEYLKLASPRIFDVCLGSGCTYACKFCVTSAFWERTFRSKSPEVVLRELDYLHERYGITQVNFLHDNFANRKRYLDDFVDYFLRHNTRYEWGCAVRPDNVTRDQLARMKQAGCFNLFCGTDSGSPRLLKQMTKMPGPDRSYQLFRDCLDVGLSFETNTIVGYPNESDGELEKSLRLIFAAVAHGAINSDVSVLQPLPGAAITRDYSTRLELVEDHGLGTFLPPEARALVRGDAKLFSGFYFIRHRNRELGWYLRLANLIRYFTRHWFRTLYFLVEHLGFTFLRLLEPLLDSDDLSTLSQRFEALVLSLDLPPEDAQLTYAVLRFDGMEERLKLLDISREVENVYSPAPSLASQPSYLLDELPVPVHRVFAAMPQLDTSVEHTPTCYLWSRDRTGYRSVLHLRPWQRALWHHLQARTPDDAYIEQLVSELSSGREADCTHVRLAVDRAVDLLTRVLQTGNPQAVSETPCH